MIGLANRIDPGSYRYIYQSVNAGGFYDSWRQDTP
jgi:hypothetical protein